MEEARKRKKEKTQENSGPIHGWQMRGGGCMDITPD